MTCSTLHKTYTIKKDTIKPYKQFDLSFCPQLWANKHIEITQSEVQPINSAYEPTFFGHSRKGQNMQQQAAIPLTRTIEVATHKRTDDMCATVCHSMDLYSKERVYKVSLANDKLSVLGLVGTSHTQLVANSTICVKYFYNHIIVLKVKCADQRGAHLWLSDC